MSNVTVYLKCERNVEVQAPDVFLSDMGAVRCQEAALAAKLKAIKVHHFSQKDARRCVISVLKLVELMEKECQDISVQVLGETDVLLEWVNVHKHKGWQQWLRGALVCLVSFLERRSPLWLIITT